MYKKLPKAIGPLGSFQEEVKKASVHLVRGSAFAGVHPRKQHLLLTIKTVNPIPRPRIVRPKNRWHLEVKLAAANQIEAELLGWLRDAYELCA